MHVCVCLEVMFSAPFIRLGQGAQFFDYYFSGLGENLGYNGLRQIELISLK